MITRTEVKEAINIKPSNTAHDTFIDNLILSIKKEVNGWCGQSIEQASTALEFIGDGSQYLLLKKSPFVSVTSLKYKNKPTDSWITVTDYTVVKNEGLTYLYYEDYYSAPFFELVYTYGYEFVTSGVDNQTIDTNEVPSDIRNVALEMCIWAWTESNLSDDKSLTVASKSISEAGKTINFSYMKDWKPNWRRVLGKYRTYLL